MAQKLDNRPGQVYDPENADSKKHGGADDGKDELSPKDSANFDQIAAAEKDIGLTDGNTSATNNKEKNTSANTGFVKSKKLKTKNQKISTKRKKVIAGSMAGGIVAGGMLVSTFLAGPLQILQFSKYLEKLHFTGNSSLTEGRLGNIYRYLRYPDSPQQRRIGAIARRSAAGFEAGLKQRGLTPEWGTSRLQRGNLTRLRVDSANVPGLRSGGLGNEIKLVNGTYYIDIDQPGTTRKQARANLKNVNKVIQSLDVKVGAIGLRNMRAKAGIGFLDSSVRRGVRDAKQKIDDYKSRRAAYDDATKKQLKAASIETPNVTTTDEPDPDNPDRAPPSDTIDTSGGKTAARAKIDAVAGQAGKGLAVAGLICAAYQIADSASTVRQANVIIPLMKMGMRTLTIASQIQAGNVDITALGFYADDLYDATAKTGAKSWKEAASIQTNLGLPATGVDIPRSAHPTNGGNFILDTFNSIPGLIGKSIGSICGVVTSKAGQAVGYAVDFFSGGTSAILKNVAGELIVGQFADDLVALLAGEEVDTTLFVGALAGAGSDYGAMLSARENSISLGGKKLNTQEVVALQEYYNDESSKDMKNKSIFERYFALSNSESLFANSITKTASLTRRDAVLDNINSSGSVTNLANTVGSLFVNKAYAQTSASFSYGVQQYGFSLEEINDDRWDNPLENEELVVPILDQYESKIEKCFGLSINPAGSFQAIPNALKVVDKDRNEAGCEDGSEEWTRIRFYILDQNVASSYGCVVTNDTESCSSLGIGSTGGSSSANTGSSTTTLDAPGLNGYAVPCQGDPRTVVRLNDPNAPYVDWSGIPDSGIIGTGSDGDPIKVYIREACDTTNVKTIFLGSSIHGSENGGQIISHELLFNASLPSNVRIIAVPEINKYGIKYRDRNKSGGRINANGVNLNRNADYNWASIPTGSGGTNYKGTAPNSEPEMQALTSFLSNLGRINLSINYHDDLGYVAAVGNSTPLEYARTYSRFTPDTPLRSAESGRVYQRGALDSWHNQSTGTPTLLVELSHDQSQGTLMRHVESVQALAEMNGL